MDDDAYECIGCGHRGPSEEFHCLFEEPLCQICGADLKQHHYRQQAEFFKVIGGRPEWNRVVVEKAVLIEDGQRRQVDVWGHKTADGYTLRHDGLEWSVTGPDGTHVCAFADELEAGVLLSHVAPEGLIT